ncbi:MAG: trypsin-like serine protease [Myxococcota bacterium]
MPLIRLFALCAVLTCCAQRARPNEDAAVSAVVALYNEQLGLACSGVRVASDLVLTARHCVARVDGNSCNARFASPVSAQTLRVTGSPRLFHGDGTHAVAVYVPDGDRLCGDDLAVLKLAAALPGSSQARIEKQLATASTYRAIGYGALNTRGTGLGERRVHGTGILQKQHNGRWQGSIRVCAGDSGSPALSDDGRVLAILSHAPAQRGCWRGTYTPLEAHAAWLASVLTRAGAR